MHVSQFLVDPCLLHLSLVYMIPIQMDFYLIPCQVYLNGNFEISFSVKQNQPCYVRFIACTCFVGCLQCK